MELPAVGNDRCQQQTWRVAYDVTFILFWDVCGVRFIYMYKKSYN